MPVDGTLPGPADLDESTLTEELLTHHHLTVDAICDDVLNIGAVFEIIASASAERSTFAGVARLVNATQFGHNPSARPADRYASAFGSVAVLLTEASWILTGNSARCLAMLVMATPCPFILAVPVAIASGLSHCAKQGVLVKGSDALERLVLADTLFFDRTGTPTSGFARLVDVGCAPRCTSNVVLGLAGLIAQAPNHVVAEAVAKIACEQGVKLRLPDGVVKSPGAGVCGRVDGHVIPIGLSPYVLDPSAEPPRVKAFAKRVSCAGASVVFVGVNSELTDALQLIGHVRLEAFRAFRFLRRKGIKRQTILTGDRADVAESVESMLGVTEVHTALSSVAKLVVIRSAHADSKVIMAGDGVNDTPMLATVDIGVAMGACGAVASSEAADIVLLVDRLGRLINAVWIAHRTRSMALQSVMIDVSLSLATMAAAVPGHLPSLAGAILQELIDVLAIASTLGALLPTPDETTRSLVCADVERLKAECAELEPTSSRIRLVAGTLPHMGGNVAKDTLLPLNQSLADVLIPHERRGDTQLYPDVAHLLSGDDSMAAMSAMHCGIFCVTSPLGRTVADVSADGLDAVVTQELQRLLCGLDAILRLYYAQEDELFHMFGGEA